MLWLALLGAQAIFPDHQPSPQDDLDARSEETTEPAVLRSGHPDAATSEVMQYPVIVRTT
jgi:hypothetical protein